MHYTMTTPCPECPFLNSMKHGFTMQRLREFASGEFPCHRTAEYHDEDDGDDNTGFYATRDSQHCAGALIFNERRNRPHQMMRITERLGLYDRTKLDMNADVRG